MYDHKTIKVSANYGKFKFTYLLLILFIFSACRDECTTSYALYNAYYQAVIYPESFDEYVQNNKTDFTDDIYECIDEKSRSISDKVKEERQFCDEAHVQGSDFWNDCYDDIDQAYGGIYNALEAIKQVAQNGKSYEQTEFGLYMILGKNMMEQGEWVSLMGQLIPETKEYLKCEKCENKFFLF